MADQEQLQILKQGARVWNEWHRENQTAVINLYRADLHGADLREAHLWGADLSGANLSGAILMKADLSDANLAAAYLRGADLSGASLIETNLDQANLCGSNLGNARLFKARLWGADLSGANLSGANLMEADLRNTNLVESNLTGAILMIADLTEADLTEANLRAASLVYANLTGTNLSRVDLTSANLTGANLRKTDMTGADLTGANLSGANLVQAVVSNAKISKSNVYGISVWDLEGELKEQKDLIITPRDQSAITVDNIEIAQFVYLILNNKKIRNVINTLTSKTILILGRFALPERKAILDALRDRLREYDLLPIVFDFDRPADKDFTETIKTLAGLSYFVIADVTNPKSSPLELQATIPDYQIPFVPIIQEGESPFAMMVDLQKKYNWVLNTVTYDSMETLIKVLKPLIIDPAMKKHNELRIIKARVPEVISGKDYVEKGNV